MNTEKNLYNCDEYKFSSLQKDFIKEIISGYCETENQADGFISEFEHGVLFYVAGFGSQIPLSEKESNKQIQDLIKTFQKLSGQLSNLDLFNSILINNNYIYRNRVHIRPYSDSWKDKLCIDSLKMALACSDTLNEKRNLKRFFLEPEGVIVQAIENAAKLHCTKIKIKDGTDSIAVKLVQVIKDDFCFQKTAQRVVTRYLKHNAEKETEDSHKASSKNNNNKKSKHSKSFKEIQNKFLYKKIDN